MCTEIGERNKYGERKTGEDLTLNKKTYQPFIANHKVLEIAIFILGPCEAGMSQCSYIYLLFN